MSVLLKSACWSFCLLLCAAPSLPQSLAEVAQKEKKRRQNLPASPVFREEDLKAAKGKTASEIGTASENNRRDSIEKLSATERRDSESDWDEVFQTFRVRYDAAKASRDRNLDFFNNGIPVGAELKRIPCPRLLARQFIPGYMQHAITCSSIQEDIAKQQTLMAEIQEECHNAARIRGVVPGRARLE